MAIEVKIPDLGGDEDVEVIEILVNVGDSVKKEDALITLESDKASMDVPSPEDGVVESIIVKEGDRVSEGSMILMLSGVDTGATPSDAPTNNTEGVDSQLEDVKKEAEVSPSPAAETTTVEADMAGQPRTSPAASLQSAAERDGTIHVYASPSVRHYARELGADLTRVSGTGRKGRISRDDVSLWVKQQLTGAGTTATASAAVSGGMGIPPIPLEDFSKYGEIETVALGRIKKISGPFLQRSWLNVPHVTHHDEADITELEAFRQSIKKDAEQRGVKVTPLIFMMKAVVAALKAYPNFNSSLSEDGQSLILKKYYHIGIAVDTPNGLVVPVVRDVDKKSIFDIAEELGTISQKARDGKLTGNDLKGGTFSISSLGGIGGTAFTPIVNAPEVAILGAARSRMQPVWDGNNFVPRLMQPLDVSYDHRVVDGAEAARFTAHLANMLSDFRRVLL